MIYDLEEVAGLYRACLPSYEVYHEGSGCMHMPIYEDGFCTRKECLQAVQELVIHRLHVEPNQYVLDLGCGVGAMSVEIAERFGCQVIGIAVTENEIHMASQHAEERDIAHKCHFQIGDMNNLQELDLPKCHAVINLETDCYFDSVTNANQQVFSSLEDTGVWHTIRFSTTDQSELVIRARKIAHKIQHLWKTSEWQSTKVFEHAISPAFEVVEKKDLTQKIVAFWEKMMPIDLRSSSIVRLRFALRAFQESAHISHFGYVYGHRIAFWYFISALAKGLLKYQYYHLRKKSTPCPMENAC